MVTTTFAMHHIPAEHRAAAIAEFFRVLRPGGRLLIADLYPTGRLIPRVMRGLTRILGHDDPDIDPFDDLDIGHHADALRKQGFVGVTVATTPPWTRYLTTTKPA